MTVMNAYGWTRVGMTWVPPEHELYPDDDPDLPEHVQDWTDVEPRHPTPDMTDDGRARKHCPICGQTMKERSKLCADCHAGRTMFAAGVEAEPVIVKKLRKRKRRARLAAAEPVFVDFPPFHRYRAVCEDCGCLLAHALELCPSCAIPWMRASEQAAAHATYQHHTTTTAPAERIAA